MSEPIPFRVEVPQDTLDDLDRRLRATRWPIDPDNADWKYGTSRMYLKELVDYWLDSYDWRRHEAAMNANAEFRVDVDGVPIHFVHERGKGPDAIPIILTHGWPWTFWDWAEVIGPLTDPAAHGGDPADSFDVVVPSLPGFGFSSPLEVTGVGATRTAELWVRLMRDVLGYGPFVAGGGDFGAIITTALARHHAVHLRGMYVHLPTFGPGLGGRPIAAEDYGPGEQDWAQRTAAKLATTASHIAVNTNDPQTAAYALNDSPVGLASWLIERRRNWGDCDGDIERMFSKDQLITTTMVYWVSETIGTSMRYYMAERGQPLVQSSPAPIEVPTAVGVFPGEVLLLPRKVIERETNLVVWNVHEAGGHFAPAERPSDVVDDIRALGRAVRAATL